MKTLVTGGAGFIGSHISTRLVQAGHGVRVLDNLTSGKRDNLEHLAGKVELVVGDVRDAGKLDELAAGCDVIFHQAAIVSVPYSVEHPQETHDVNIQGTLNVLAAAKKRGVKRVVFACSAAVYGEEPEQPKVETMRAAPVAPYGVEKVSLRYFNVFGPRQDPSSPYSGVISIFVDRILRGAPITIFGDGEQYRDFVYVDNVVDANIAAATKDGVSGRAYNVGCGKKTSLNELAAILGRIVGKDVKPTHAEPRAGDIRESLADISRARKELGYDPKVGVEEGLRRLVQSVTKAPS